MYMLEEMVDHALPAKFEVGSAHRKVFRVLVLHNPRVRTMSTVMRTGEWLTTLSEEEAKKVTYVTFMNEVGDDGNYRS